MQISSSVELEIWEIAFYKEFIMKVGIIRGKAWDF
jgi:hypothetical protein